jgi:hypothetical protein
MLLDLGGEFEGIDEFGRTRLANAVLSGDEITSKVDSFI